MGKKIWPIIIIFFCRRFWVSLKERPFSTKTATSLCRSTRRFNKRGTAEKHGSTTSSTVCLIPGSFFYLYFLFFVFCFSHTSTFQLLDKSRGHRCRSSLLPPRFLPSIFHRAYKGSAIPPLVGFSSSVVANSRSRAFRKSICAQEKVPTNLYKNALRGDSNSRN